MIGGRKLPSVQEQLFEAANKFSELFSTQPISGKSRIPWTTREALERELSFNLGIRDKHICIDGPSGSGKTSLVQHIFFRQHVPFIHIQISKDWVWSDFTRQFVEIPLDTKRQVEASAKGFLNFFRPGLEGGVSYKKELDKNASLDLLIKLSNSWRANDLAEWIDRNRLVLIVDDLEMASDDIIDGLAACSKILGQSYTGKIVFIGIDDIMRRIISRNNSLSRRISELSVGGLSNIGESSEFIFRKFASAGIETPGRDVNLARSDVTKCRRYIYAAANGLMKDLNDLGMMLARRAVGRDRLSISDFSDISLQFIKDTRTKNRKKIVGIMNVLKNNITYFDIFQFLLKKSASSITTVSEIDEDMSGKYSEEEIMSALEFLESQGMIVVTGVEEVRVFFKDPPLFNCFKTHIVSGAEYGWDLASEVAISKVVEQLSLALRSVQTK